MFSYAFQKLSCKHKIKQMVDVNENVVYISFCFLLLGQLLTVNYTTSTCTLL